MLLVCQRIQLKQRIHAALAKYGLKIVKVQNVFGVRGSKLRGRRSRLDSLTWDLCSEAGEAR